MTRFEVSLFCPECEEETLHEVTYAGKYLQLIRCTACDRSLEVRKDALVGQYLADLYKRISTKPSRISEEMRQDLWKFVLSFPKRAATKPVRILREIADVVHPEDAGKSRSRGRRHSAGEGNGKSL